MSRPWFTDNAGIYGRGGILSPAIKPIDVYSKLVTDNVYDLVVDETNFNEQQMIMR